MSATATHALLTRARHSFAQALTLPHRPVTGIVWLIVELRSHVKALLGGVSTKAAVTSIAVIGAGAGVGVGAVAVVKSLPEPKTPPIPVPALDEPTIQAAASAPTDGAFHSASVVPRPRSQSENARLRSAISSTSRTGTVSGGGDLLLRRTSFPTEHLPHAGATDETSEPVAHISPPAPELPVDVPVDMPELPAIEPPTLVPLVEAPPLPSVDLPQAPPLPAVDLPPVPALPTEDPPFPGVSLP